MSGLNYLTCMIVDLLYDLWVDDDVQLSMVREGILLRRLKHAFLKNALLYRLVDAT